MSRVVVGWHEEYVAEAIPEDDGVWLSFRRPDGRVLFGISLPSDHVLNIATHLIGVAARQKESSKREERL